MAKHQCFATPTNPSHLAFVMVHLKASSSSKPGRGTAPKAVRRGAWSGHQEPGSRPVSRNARVSGGPARPRRGDVVGMDGRPVPGGLASWHKATEDSAIAHEAKGSQRAAASLARCCGVAASGRWQLQCVNESITSRLQDAHVVYLALRHGWCGAPHLQILASSCRLDSLQRPGMRLAPFQASVAVHIGQFPLDA